MESRYEMLYYGGLILALVFLVAAIVLFFVFKIPKVFGELTGSTARKGVRDLKKDVANETKRKSYSQKTGAIKVHDAAGTNELNSDTTNNLGKESSRKAKKEQKLDLKVERKKNIPSMDSYDFVEDEAEITSVLTTDMPGDVNIGTPTITEVKEDTSEEVTTVLGQEDAEVDEEATEVLTEETETTEEVDTEVDEDAETEVLSEVGDDSETAVLSTPGDDSETAVLYAEDEDGATDVLRGTGQGYYDETSVLTADVQITSKRTKIIYNVIEVHTNEHL